MRTIIKIFLVLVFFAFLSVSGLVSAQGEVLNEDYGAVGEVVEIAQTVQGDVYAAGGQIFISGTVDGDVLALGGVVHISGTVTQNVRVAGGQVVVSGEVGRNATIMAMNVIFTDSARVKGGVVAGGANVLLAAPVAKEARIAGRNFTLASTVDGEVEAAVENIRLSNNAKVGGNFTYWSNRELVLEEGAEVAGAIQQKSPQQLTGKIEEITGPLWSWGKPFVWLASFFTTLILGLLLVRLFPAYTGATVHILGTRKWRCLMSGVTALLLIPLLFGLLIITVVGIPLGLLLLVASSVILYSVRIFVMLFIGRMVTGRFREKRGDSFAFFIGLVLYSFLVLTPAIGWALSLGAVVFGLGAATESLKEIYAKARAEKNSRS